VHVCRYYHDDDLLPEGLRSELEETLYSAFVGREPDRGSAARETEHAASVPPPVRQTLDRLVRTVGFTRFTRGNERLSERIAHEAVHWVGERWGEMEHADPFVAEEREIGSAAQHDELSEIARLAVARRPSLRAVAKLVTRDPGPEPATDRSRPTAGLPGRTRIIAEADRDARRRLLLGSWRERVTADRDHHQARLLGRALGGLIRELETIVPRLAEEQRLVRDVLGNEDALWDLSRHEWEELPPAGLHEAADMLAEHPEIERLAAVLGRSKAVTARRTRVITERFVRRRPVGIGKSEVTGIRAGDDLTSLVTSELALLSQPETEDLFYAKLAHRELLVLDYNRQRIVEDVTLRPVSVSESVPVERGPAIVCVDTSGSMLGLPERVAKAAVLALARRLAEDRRRIEVIAFASDVRSFTMDHESTRLPELARFLAGAFHGGTDLSRALGTAVRRLDEAEYDNADVLVISDFRVPKIADRHLAAINRQHHRGTLFHSLTVARRQVVDPLHIFDSSWLFSTESGRIAPESLRAIS